VVSFSIKSRAEKEEEACKIRSMVSAQNRSPLQVYLSGVKEVLISYGLRVLPKEAFSLTAEGASVDH
jgi:hypothetical protein